MDEQKYTRENRERWQKISDLAKKASSRGVKSCSADELESFITSYKVVSSQLAYVRTQGASKELEEYLNGLAARLHAIIYKHKKHQSRGFFYFFTNTFPTLFRQTWKYSLAAMVLFSFFWGLGTYIAILDSDAGSKVVPKEVASDESASDSFVSVEPIGLSSFIMLNNIRVGILAFAGGILASLGTIFILSYNGLQIGTTVTLVGLSSDTLRLVSLLAPHGVIELTAIFICGGAGLYYGTSLIAPGNVKRIDAMVTKGRVAVQLFLGTIPMFIIAGLIEGYLTPSATTNFFKLVFAAFTLIVMVAYLGFTGHDNTATDTQAQ